MQLPFSATLPRFFSLPDVEYWVSQVKPTQIEMNDNQYAWYANLRGANKKDHNGIPIIFLDSKTVV